LESFTSSSPARENGRAFGGALRHDIAMAQTISTSHISYVANLLRHSAPAMPEVQDKRLFLKAAEALENRAVALTHGVPATSGGRLDLLV
jgi:hypothetical protein